MVVQLPASQGFWLAETECSQELWSRYISNNQVVFVVTNFQLEQVRPLDVRVFLTLLGDQLSIGDNLRLPSEAEWGTPRSGSAAPWYMSQDLEGGIDDLRRGLASIVALYAAIRGRYPDALGLYDMHGDVSELVSSGCHLIHDRSYRSRWYW